MAMKLISLNSSGKSIIDEYSDNIFQREKILIFKSNIDGNLETITYILPNNYDKNKKYPLLIICSAYYHDIQSYKFLKLDDYIVADISGRGILTGSYQNEAQFIESMKQLLKFCSVDMSRIYLTGYSNGAYDVWSFAENYPNLFAGIYPVSGRPIKDAIFVLKDVRTLVISSNKDNLYEFTYQYPLEQLSKYGNCYGYLVDNINHLLLFNCMFTKFIYNQFFKSVNHYNISIDDFKIKTENRKLGLAGIYIRELVVCTEEKYNNIAENFASPKCCGYDRNINIKYPIKTLPDENDIKKSIIFIDIERKNKYIDKLKDILPVKCFENNFTYLGTTYSGSYSVIQIIKNPYYTEERFLIIQASDNKAVRSNFYLRQFILSSYANGYNPFINCEILVQFNNTFYSTREDGLPLEKIISS
jgi:hypothetical protein